MAGEALAGRDGLELLGQMGLSDARFAAQMDGLTAARLAAVLDHAAELA